MESDQLDMQISNRSTLPFKVFQRCTLDEDTRDSAAMKKMGHVSMEMFRNIFKEGVRHTLMKAQELLGENLPDKIVYVLADSSKIGKFIGSEEILSQLYHSGSFPRIVDLAVCGIHDGETVVWVRPSAHPLTTQLKETWNQPKGSGPFKAAGLMLPSYLWGKGPPFSLSDLEEALLQ